MYHLFNHRSVHDYVDATATSHFPIVPVEKAAAEREQLRQKGRQQGWDE
jgi:hypothetical protein